MKRCSSNERGPSATMREWHRFTPSERFAATRSISRSSPPSSFRPVDRDIPEFLVDAPSSSPTCSSGCGPSRGYYPEGVHTPPIDTLNIAAYTVSGPDGHPGRLHGRPQRGAGPGAHPGALHPRVDPLGVDAALGAVLRGGVRPGIGGDVRDRIPPIGLSAFLRSGRGRKTRPIEALPAAGAYR